MAARDPSLTPVSAQWRTIRRVAIVVRKGPDMTRPAPVLTRKLRSLAHAARSMLMLEHLAEPVAVANDAAAKAVPMPEASGCMEGIAICDWDALFSAVKERLRLSVAHDPAAAFGTQLAGNACDVKDSVLECVGALDQLQLTMAHEMARCQSVELQAFDEKTAQAQARCLGR
jgi:hypothetical protein